MSCLHYLKMEMFLMSEKEIAANEKQIIAVKQYKDFQGSRQLRIVKYSPVNWVVESVVLSVDGFHIHCLMSVVIPLNQPAVIAFEDSFFVDEAIAALNLVKETLPNA